MYSNPTLMWRAIGGFHADAHKCAQKERALMLGCDRRDPVRNPVCEAKHDERENICRARGRTRAWDRGDPVIAFLPEAHPLPARLRPMEEHGTCSSSRPACIRLAAIKPSSIGPSV